MPEPPVVLRREGDLACLVLNAPPQNRMDGRFLDAFTRLAEGFSALEIRGMIVRGAGRHFSAGADVEELRDGLAGSDPQRARLTLEATSRAFQALAEAPWPTVAAVAGACLGSGLELALACRFRIAAETAVFALPEVTFGLLPGCGGTVRLPRLVGLGPALDLILTGRLLGAVEARQMGLVDAVTGRHDLPAAAERLLTRLAVDAARGAT